VTKRADAARLSEGQYFNLDGESASTRGIRAQAWTDAVLQVSKPRTQSLFVHESTGL
jgi:hypothetical protein